MCRRIRIAIVHDFSNLVVMAVEIDYLIGMKLLSARGQDLKDVADILMNNADLQPFDLLEKLVDMSFNIDISILLK